MEKSWIWGLFALVFSIAILPAGSEALCETYCHNLTHINATCDAVLNDTTYTIRQGPLECVYGCDNALGICEKYPGDPIPGEYLYMFEVAALILLIFGIYRLDAGDDDIHAFDVILPLITFILFITLALQANNVIDTTTGDVMRIIYVVYIDYGLSFIAIILFFMSLFKYIKSGTT